MNRITFDDFNKNRCISVFTIKLKGNLDQFKNSTTYQMKQGNMTAPNMSHQHRSLNSDIY